MRFCHMKGCNMKGSFNTTFIGSTADERNTAVTILGCPLDATSSFRGGTKFAPDSIRRASWTLETYSPYLKKDLEDIAFYDSGNLEIPAGDLSLALNLIEDAVSEATEQGKKTLILGGEHLITYPILKGMKKTFPVLQLIHFDAHCDLRDEYEGQKLSHATAIRRVKDLGMAEIHQIGIRSGTRQEFDELRAVYSPASLRDRLIPDMPVYLTFDLDVFDPSLAAGVTTPEPGGLMFQDVMEFFSVLVGANIVGADIVELAPDYDATFVSSICAAKVAREVLMLLDS
ncbi:MAG TPA: agmatinase [Deltaproteobacteria bacterium]|nr:agmatinase [Deltaproteobacteria bacterium]